LTSVIDLWIWAVCLMAILGPLIARLVGSEISSGTAKLRHHGRGFAWFALAFVLLYNGPGRCCIRALHGSRFADLSGRPTDPGCRHAARGQSLPLDRLGGNQAFWVAADVDLLGDFDPTRMHHPAQGRARTRTGCGARHPYFSGIYCLLAVPLTRVTPVPVPENGKLVQTFDLRFSLTPSAGFTASAVVDRHLR
jgi:hypothetical protein